MLTRKTKQQILAALRDHGGATLLRPGMRAQSRRVRDQVEQVLAALFDLATADAEAERIDEFEVPLEWLADLHGRLQWGQGVEEDKIFLELFVRLRDARQNWYRDPREPFDVSGEVHDRIHTLKVKQKLTRTVLSYKDQGTRRPRTRHLPLLPSHLRGLGRDGRVVEDDPGS